MDINPCEFGNEHHTIGCGCGNCTAAMAAHEAEYWCAVAEQDERLGL